ncbi:porin family protein [Mucilaginibacter ginsenosidivorax]|uniref:PorT family protein n=1 Tax=Mucilaginibacter ginsenosidivorax TaxID=862126 RepID=A0A5B8W4E7_9SPHI|nr:porin family protein [Mucilaginibacter ginsenosidivorax]QEC77198.1 PorT family protein [Mucilaginibacter ginsenosidivorax]
MKKYLLSAALLIAVSISAQAQFSLGVKGGVNFSKINTDNLKESTLTGYQAGLFARIGSGLYLQPELYLSGTGGKFSSSDNGTDYSGKVRFTNLNVPLLLGKSFGGKDLNFRVMAGPIYTYQLDKSTSFSNNFTGAYQDFGNYNKSTLGFQAGAGVDIGAITADLRYEGGLSKVNSNYGQRQNLWALSVGFKIF